MGMFYTNTNYDIHGRRRRKLKPKGDVYKKFEGTKFTEMKAEAVPAYSRGEDHREKYPSLGDGFGRPGDYGVRKERPVYTGTLIKGIATMHKSNAVPVMNQEQATDIANMRR
jgi:hypothetical protein